jgi:hypothetical protein
MGGARRLAFAVALWLAAAACAASGTRATAPAPIRHHPGFPVMGMVPLAGDQLLLWHGDGRAQVRTTSGAWGDVFRLPVQAIQDIQPDAEGFLVAGSPQPGRSAAVLLTPRGDERTRWEMNDAIFSLLVDAQGRRAVTQAGTVPLLADGKVGPPEPLPGGAQSIGVPSAVLRRDGVTVVCRGADLSMQHASPGFCERSGPGGWRFESNFLAPPLLCGAWLVVLDGPQLRRLTVLSLATGKIEGRIAASVRPVFTCAGPAELLLGDRRLALLRLPKGRPLWTRSLGGSARTGVSALAVLESFIAYQVEDSPDVFLLPRPTVR